MTLLNRRTATVPPREHNACSAAAFWRPYSVFGFVGSVGLGSALAPSNTRLVDRNTTGVPAFTSFSATATLPDTLTLREPVGSLRHASWLVIAAQRKAASNG